MSSAVALPQRPPTYQPARTFTVTTAHEFTPEEQALRRTRLGASEVAAALGLDPRKSPYQLWAEKRGLTSGDDVGQQKHAKMGKLLEPIIGILAEEHYRAVFAEDIATKGVSIEMVQPIGTTIGPEPWMAATLDRDVRLWQGDQLIDEWIAECKAKWWRSFREFGAAGTDWVPRTILCQGIWQMFVANRQRCDVPVLVDGLDFHMYTLRAVPALAHDIVDRARSWWNLHVVRGVEPDVIGIDVPHLKKNFALATDDLLEADDRSTAAVSRLADATRAVNAAKFEQSCAQAQLMKLMGSHRAVRTTAGKAMWVNQKNGGRSFRFFPSNEDDE